MVKKDKVIDGLQTIVTELSQQADSHVIQSRVFAAAGYSKLEEKYANHAGEERGYVQQCIDRLIDLGVDVKCDAKQPMKVYKDPIEYIKADLEESVEGLAWLKDLVISSRDDVTTYDILKDYYEDEEGDMYWSENALDLIKAIGKQNWLAQQV